MLGGGGRRPACWCIEAPWMEGEGISVGKKDFFLLPRLASWRRRQDRRRQRCREEDKVAPAGAGAGVAKTRPRGQTRGATSNLLAIDPRMIFWTRTHTRRVSGGSRVPAGLKPDSYKQCTEYQIQVTKSASATTTSPEPLQCNNRRLIRGQIAAPNLPKAFRCNHQSIMSDSGSSYQ